MKKVLLAIVAIIAIVLIIPLFTAKEYTIEREITINKPKQDVFSYIRLLRNADHFNKWMMTDPNSKKEFRGTDGTKGFIYAWDSENKKIGKGEQEITNIAEGSRIDYELRFVKPFEGKGQSYLVTEDDGSNTKVKWGFAGKMPYPMNIMLLLGMKKSLGDDLSTSLSNMKSVMEK